MPKLLFLIPTFTVRTAEKRNLRSLTGGFERIDVISRCLLNAFRWTNRLNYEIHLFIYFAHVEELKLLKINSSELNRTIISEVDALDIIVKLLNTAIKNDLFEKISFKSLIYSLYKDNYSIFYLSSDGEKLDKIEIKEKEKDLCFVLGSQNDLSEEQERILKEFKVRTISLGDKEYLASHVITLISHYLSSL